MSRHRWYHARWRLGIRGLADRIDAYRWGSDERVVGFVLDRAFDNLIDARFVERVDIEEEAVDPFGASQAFLRTEYRKLRFIVTNSQPSLEIVGSSRAPAQLLNKLAEVSDHEMVVEDVAVDVFEWIRSFQDSINVDGYIDIVQIGKIELGADIVARAIIHGRSDVSRTMVEFTGERKFQVEKMQFRFAERQYGSIAFSRSSSLVIRARDEGETVAHARKSLEEVLRRGTEARPNERPFGP